MDGKEKEQFEALYERHCRALKLQGKREKTIDSYSRSVRRLAEYFDRCPDDLGLSANILFHSFSDVIFPAPPNCISPLHDNN